MTYYERLQNALHSEVNEGTLDDLLKYAYYAGKEKGVREASDMADARWREQVKKAEACRYYKMAMEIVGEAAEHTCGKGFTYHPDYSMEWTSAFSNNMWNGE